MRALLFSIILLFCNVAIAEQSKIPLTKSEREAQLLSTFAGHPTYVNIVRCYFHPSKCDIVFVDGIVYVYSDFIEPSIYHPKKHILGPYVIMFNSRCSANDYYQYVCPNT